MAAGGIVIYHTTETSPAHLALQARLPVSAVNVGEGVSLPQVRDAIGNDRCLMGNFDPILLRDGTPEDVAAAAERMVRENAPRGGYIFNTGEGGMANSPVANVDAMMRGARAAADA